MILKQDFFYPPAGQDRTLHIWLPEDYYRTEERYPVMYFFDGHNLFSDAEATYGKSWGLADFLARWEKPIIIVGMECSHEGNNRLQEYCPYKRKVLGQQMTGLGRETARWIADEVKPYIDRTFRTYAHREATAIGGSSMGGIMSVYTLLCHNDVFSKAACLSPSTTYNHRYFQKDLATHALHPDSRMYLAWGEREVKGPPKGGDARFDSKEAIYAWALSRGVEAKGAMSYVYMQPEGEHCEACWEAQVPRFMNYLWLDRKEA